MHMDKKKQKSYISKVVSLIISCFLIGIILINVTMIIKSYLYPNKFPSVFGISPVVVLSGSMEPVFGVEDLILIKEVDNEKLKKGDIIAFIHGEVAVTHRINDVVYEEDNIRYITKGDANNAIDHLKVRPEQVQGLYFKHYDRLGGVLMFMQSPVGIFLFIVMPIIIFMAYDILVRKKEGQADRDRANELEQELAQLKAEKAQNEQGVTSNA